jgi:hypothetical protein
MWRRKTTMARAVVPEDADADGFVTLGATILIASGALLCILAANRTQGTAAARPLLMQFLGFAINAVSVSVPARFDSDVQATSTMQFPWPTLLSPAGFAFAICAQLSKAPTTFARHIAHTRTLLTHVGLPVSCVQGG